MPPGMRVVTWRPMTFSAPTPNIVAPAGLMEVIRPSLSMLITASRALAMIERVCACALATRARCLRYTARLKTLDASKKRMAMNSRRRPASRLKDALALCIRVDSSEDIAADPLKIGKAGAHGGEHCLCAIARDQRDGSSPCSRAAICGAATLVSHSRRCLRMRAIRSTWPGRWATWLCNSSRRSWRAAW